MRSMLLAALAALGGCLGAEQTEACRAFVACTRALDARDGQTTDAARFEADGACWSGPVIAELCDQACTRGVEWLREVEPDLVCEVTP